MSAPIEALLFDLGGVIIELDWERVFSHWARCAGKPVAPVREGFAFDVPYQRHERGEIDAAAYYESLRRSLQLDIPDAEFDSGWKALFVQAIPETVEMIRAVRGRIPLHLFSNSNAAHRQAWSTRFAAALEPFDKTFVSSDIGRRKPSRESFEHVAAQIGVPLASILFLDDTMENVEGARAAGMPAVHVRSPQDVRNALRPWLVTA
jgi:HAD superfamily hydrolase (TIGR01509 family)